MKEIRGIRMRIKYFTNKMVLFCALCVAIFTSQADLQACTRAVYIGDDKLVMVGRSMDWREEQQYNLWAFPKGMKKDSNLGEKSAKWTSKYGSLSVTGYDGYAADGINEKGLSASLLFLAESDYGKGTHRPQLSIAVYVQYILDNYATVKEAVEDLKQDKFQIVTALAAKDKPANVHFSITDASGDSAILEFLKGKLVIHHSKEYKVMTNSPTYEKQLALNAYWKEIGGLVMLPGTNRAADRFVRASYYINAIPKTSDVREAVAATRSVICNVSVPRGIQDATKPNIATTVYRSVRDLKNKVYYYESTQSPNIFWVDLKKLNLKKGSPVMKLDLENNKRILNGESSSKFLKAKPFKWMGPNTQPR